jgi:hypothetical protein
MYCIKQTNKLTKYEKGKRNKVSNIIWKQTKCSKIQTKKKERFYKDLSFQTLFLRNLRIV